MIGPAELGSTLITLFELDTKYSGNAANPTPLSTANNKPMTLLTFIIDFRFLLSFTPNLSAQSGLNTGEGAPLPKEINLCLLRSLTVLGIPYFSKYFGDP